MTDQPDRSRSNAKKQSVGSLNTSAHSAASAPRRASSLRHLSSSRRLSSVLSAARKSFFRSRGERGASVETLRGTKGAAFEAYATVHRGDPGFGLAACGCCGGSDGVHFLLIKGEYCFVFADEASKSPEYAIDLMNKRAVVVESHDAAYTSIDLETSLGDVEYKLMFADMDKESAAKFCNAVAASSNEAIAEAVQKKLGHQDLAVVRHSVHYANQIGAKKEKEQPEEPLGAGEVMAGMPVPDGVMGN